MKDIELLVERLKGLQPLVTMADLPLQPQDAENTELSQEEQEHFLRDLDNVAPFNLKWLNKHMRELATRVGYRHMFIAGCLSEWGVWSLVRLDEHKWGWVNIDFNCLPVCTASTAIWAVVKMLSTQQHQDIKSQVKPMHFNPSFGTPYLRLHTADWLSDTIKHLSKYD